MRHLAERNQPTRVRYVVVPGYTDDERSAHLLGEFIGDMDNVEMVELLPYHAELRTQMGFVRRRIQINGRTSAA